MVSGTVEVVVVSSTVVVVSGTVDVVVVAGAPPCHTSESKSHKSHSTGKLKLSMALPSFAVTSTSAIQHEPSIGLSSVVPSV